MRIEHKPSVKMVTSVKLMLNLFNIRESLRIAEAKIKELKEKERETQACLEILA
jgi:hypothetical protein